MRIFRARALAVLLVLAGTGLAGSARADEGRIPIYGPTIISQPGHYVLTRSFCFASSPTPPCVSGTFGIHIASSDVTVDLNGHTISTSADQNIVYVDSSAANRGLTLRNGSLVGGGSPAGVGNGGIYTTNSSPVEIKIEDLEIRNLGGNAVEINATKSVRILRCRILDAVQGIVAIGTATPFDAIIADNSITGVDGFGMDLEGVQNGQILRNIVRDFGGNQTNAAGIRVESLTSLGEAGGNRIEGNIVSAGGRGLDDDGITVFSLGSAASPHNLIVDNVLTGNGRYGLVVSSDENRIERNVASGNGGDGIHVGLSATGARNDLEGNQAQGNGGCGIAFTNFNSHIYRNNVMRNNTGGDVCGFGAPSTNAGGNICTAACP